MSPESCRLCLLHTEDLSSLFLSFYEDRYLHDILSELINLKIEDENMLPRFICDSCTTQVVSFYEFKKMCYSTDVTLRNSLQSNAAGKSDPLQTVMDIEEELLPDNAASQSDPDTNILGNLPQNDTAIESEWPQTEDTCDPLADEENKEFSAEGNEVRQLPVTAKVEDTIAEEHCYSSGWVTINLLCQLSTKCSCRLNDNSESHQYDLLELYHMQVDAVRAMKKASSASTPQLCAQCGKSFPNMSEYLKHMRWHKVKDNGPAVCEVCGKVINTMSNLQKHLWVHSGYKPNICELCGKGLHISL